MRRLFCLLASFLALSLMAAAPVSAQSLHAETLPAAPGLATAEDQTLLKAVLIVGPLDGDSGPSTLAQIDSMEQAAAVLENNGVTVWRFYTPDNDWDQIRAAANGAHFLLYRGHGVYSGGMPSPSLVGGFALKGHTVSVDEIRAGLRLSPNAVVMLYGCFTAGTASNDPAPIDLAEASRRVAMYSDPFFDLGAAGYYANWFGDAFASFLTSLFQGDTLGEAYEGFYDFNDQTVRRETHPDHPGLDLWLDKNDWDGIKYSNAFAGRSGETLADLFPGSLSNPGTEPGQSPSMELSRDQITLLVEVGDPVQPQAVAIRSSTGEPFQWTASADTKGWLSLVPASGSSGDTLQVVIDPPDQPGTHTATISVQASPEVSNGSQSLPVRVTVAEDLAHLYLPLAAR